LLLRCARFCLPLGPMVTLDEHLQAEEEFFDHLAESDIGLAIALVGIRLPRDLYLDEQDFAELLPLILAELSEKFPTAYLRGLSDRITQLPTVLPVIEAAKHALPGVRGEIVRLVMTRAPLSDVEEQLLRELPRDE